MGVTKEQLASIISGRAKHLCNPSADKLIESFTRNSDGGINNPNPSDYDYDAESFDRMYLSTLDGGNKSDFSYSAFSAENSKLPEHIKKSMIEQRIDTSSLGGASVLDSLGLNQQTQRRKPVVQEQVTQSNMSTPQNVDYSIIKAIVNECLREFFEKQPINESTSLQTIGLNNGTISLVDNKGNIFKAKLEKIGNTKDKK